MAAQTMGNAAGRTCAHCGAPVTYVRAPDGDRWLSALDAAGRAAEAAPGRALVVQVDGEWRAVTRVHELMYHVCPLQLSDRKDNVVAVAPRLARARATAQTAQEKRAAAEAKRKEKLAERRAERIRTYWSTGRKAEVMAKTGCPTCEVGPGEPCLSLDMHRREDPWSAGVLEQPHPERRALLPKSPQWLAAEETRRKKAEQKLAEKIIAEQRAPMRTWADVQRLVGHVGARDLGDWLTANGDLFGVDQEPRPAEVTDPSGAE